MDTVRVTRMTGALGATVEGVDLNALDDESFARVKQAFLQHGVIAIRGQSITPQSLIAFGKRFGQLTMTLGTETNLNQHKRPDEVLIELEGYPEIFHVRNLGKAKSLTEHWHCDNTHVPRPTALSILAARQLPSAGGDTMFCNQYLAYETLSPGLKRTLRGMRLKHSGANIPAYRGAPEDAIPYAIHPLVPTHPDTGRRYLFMGGRPSPARNCFVGWTQEETLPLQKYLFEHSFEPSNCWRHRWQPGDVVVWDNRCTMHYAVHDYGEEVRDMIRVTVEGDAPVETPYDD